MKHTTNANNYQKQNSEGLTQVIITNILHTIFKDKRNFDWANSCHITARNIRNRVQMKCILEQKHLICYGNAE